MFSFSWVGITTSNVNTRKAYTRMSIATFDVSQDLPCSFLAAGRNFQKLPSLRSTRRACSLKKDRDIVWDRLVPHPSMHRSILFMLYTL